MRLVSAKHFHTLMVFLLLLCGLQSTHAAIPDTLNYQAFLTDDNGVPVDGLVSMSFKVYDVEVGGVELWSDSRTVNVVQGQFSVELGEAGNPFPLNLFETPLWIGLTIETDAEMLPRRPISSTGYSFKAQDANTLEGSTAAALDQSAHVGDLGNPHNVTAAQTGAIDAVNFSNHVLNTSAHHAPYTDGEAVLAILGADGAGSTLDADTVDGVDSTGFGTAAAVAANTAGITANQADITSNQADIAALQATVAQLQAQNATLTRLLDSLSVSADSKQIYITGANLHVRSGSGATDGTVNGLGNVIVGYDEPRAPGNSATCSLGEYETEVDCTGNGGVWAISHKSGSHNIVVGVEQNYSRHSGLVAGGANTISGEYASVTGGVLNTASGFLSSISGGSLGEASGEGAWIGGGSKNVASGLRGAVSGGTENNASGQFTTISGGRNNETIGYASSIAGGGGVTPEDGNLAVANYSAILGGLNNLAGDGACAFNAVLGRVACSPGVDNAIGEQSTVSGGQANAANGPAASVGGGGGNVASGDRAIVNGGFQNTASALTSTVSGGSDNTASGDGSSVSGGKDNVAEAAYSSITGGQLNNVSALATVGTVSGGFQNTASGVASAVTGGEENEASGVSSSVSGGRYNKAIGLYASVSGGGSSLDANGNEAIGDYASVSGGNNNNAVADFSSISGGASGTANGDASSISGGSFNTSDGTFASVSGGQSRTAPGLYDWRAGSLFEEQ